MNTMSLEEMSESVVKRWPQVVATFVVTIGTFGCGTALAWSGPAIPSLQESLCQESCYVTNITDSEVSWIASLMPVGAALSGPVAGWLVWRVGPRWTMITCAIPYLLGSILYILAYHLDNVRCIYAGRVLTGFSGGAYLMVTPIYIMDIAQSHLRGGLASTAQFMLTAGVTFVNGLSINGTVTWNTISAICLWIPVSLILLVPLVPEGPGYLISHDNEKEALRSLKKLRGGNYNIEQEFQAIKERIASNQGITTVTLRQLLSKPQYVKPFAIVMVLMFLQQFCGANAVIFYVQTIFIDAGSHMDPGLQGFLVSFAQLTGNVLAILVVDRFGRKVLLFFSTSLMALMMVALAVFFYIKDNSEVTCPLAGDNTDMQCVPLDGKFPEELADDLGWLPLVSMILYMVSFSIGAGPIPWTIMAEIFLPEALPLAASIGSFFNWFCAFLVTKFEADMEEGITVAGTYLMYGMINVCCAVFIVTLVPETKGMTPQQLEQRFRGNKAMKEKPVTSQKN